MSVILYIENTEGKIKKGTLEAASYASALAQNTSSNAIGISIGNVDAEELKKVSQYGLGKIVSIALEESEINHEVVANILSTEFNEQDGSHLVMSNTWLGKGAGPRIAIQNNMGIVSEVVALPEGNVVKKKGFSNKAFINIECTNPKNIFAISPNSFGLKENKVDAEISEKTYAADSQLTHLSFNKDTDKISLTDAELVISAGRGLKGPENWGIIDELAETLGAGTACSKPVSDAGWRPHSEHVGQTGITISPNLYIAIGISGAIQHLAGVSSSKKIVVINTDPEAPFFKAADYGIVGDAFDVVPKLTEAFKKIKT